MCVCMCMCVFVCSESSYLHPERRGTAKCFCCAKPQQLLIKLEKLIPIWSSFLCWLNPYKGKQYVTTLNMVKIKAREFIKYLKKKSMTLEEIHENIV